ncbi:hypothetical protein Q3G72_022079 [Acer saccharum]|nr:hypothetical protein Q3G72_022079 [Acer saccharum]
MIEAFNSMLKDFKARTFLNLIEFIRRMVMAGFQVRKEVCGKWKYELPPNVNKKIVENGVESRILKIIHAGEGKYELMGLCRAYTAKLQEKICDCGAWQISGVPCSHALAGIRHLYGMSGIKEDITQFIHPSLSKSSFLRTYSSMISHILDLCVLVDMKASPIDSPPIKKKPGRPKLIRKRESHEKPKAFRSGSVVCTRCRNPAMKKSSTNARAEVGASSSQPPT